MDYPHIGEIVWVPFTFAPVGWASCNGQLLPIAENEALFTLIGTTYGGDGQTTFAVPDLRGRVAIGHGRSTASGLNRTSGQTGGAPHHTLAHAEMPLHQHSYQVTDRPATSSTPGGALAGGERAYVPVGDASVAPAASTAVGVVGGSQPHENTQPSLGLHAIIATEGLFPSFS